MSKPAWILAAVTLVVVAVVVALVVLVDPATGAAGGLVASLLGAGALAERQARERDRQRADLHVRTLRERALRRMEEVRREADRTAAGTDRERTADELRRRLGL